uniref:Uncharacterized protein n=1 Tax=Equus caballus TaxID=9796 RepID=A0A9L0RNK2_HORSE
MFFCENTSDFCMLILYPATLLYLMISHSFLVALTEFSMYRIMSPATVIILLLPFQFGCLLFHFLPKSSGQTSSAILNKSGKRGHPCLFPVLRGMAFSFSQLTMMLAVGLSYVDFIMLR